MGVCMNMPEAPVQLDAALGWANAAQEMLLHASPDKVKLLPALPKRWKKGRFEGLRFCTGSVDCRRDLDAGCFEAVIAAERDTQVTVSLRSASATWYGPVPRKALPLRPEPPRAISSRWRLASRRRQRQPQAVPRR